jgi:D-galactarolactone isomerase
MSGDQGGESTPVPAGACDTHIHFYDHTYPSAPSALIHPPDAHVDDYRALQSEMGLDRLVIVQPTTYGLDNSRQLDAGREFGDRARFVVVIDDTTTDHEIARLTALGARGARFHMLPGGAVPWKILDAVASQVAPFGWHVQLQLDGRELERRIDQLRRLPVDIVVDHVGRFTPPVDIEHPSFRALVDLLESGRGWVKLSAPYESSTTGPPGYTDVQTLIDELVARVPERLLWATNWPHPGQPDPPSTADLARLIEQWTPDATTLQRILVDNPAELYGF